MDKALFVAWNIIRVLIGLFVLYFAYRCAPLAGMGDGPDALPGATEHFAYAAAFDKAATNYEVTAVDGRAMRK